MRKKEPGVERQLMVPQVERSRRVGGVDAGQGERCGDGWAAFPGPSSYLSRCENVDPQRLLLGQGWPAPTGNRPSAVSQSFSEGVAAIPPSLALSLSLPGTPTLSLTPSLPPPPTPPPPHSLSTLPHLSLSGMPAQGRQGQAGPVKRREDVCPAYGAF
ncbi:unnamed protein product [Pleuronectes platessa]|uniref:Uncharacterized protein n=1 Tax=Pleuronectes platessa TaxID=8262 RepID=A0A9N7Z2D3_PLEPL|nr:unnamed protein product [Pleuronectes platessa]